MPETPRMAETHAPHVRQRPASARSEERGDRGRDGPGEAPLDPLSRALWDPSFAMEAARPALALPAAAAPTAAAPTPGALPPGLDALVDRFVRRVAMSGDRRRGTAHLEIGSGDLAGGSMTFHAEGGQLSLTLDLPPGADAEAWRRRIGERLRARGLDASIDVRS